LLLVVVLEVLADHRRVTVEGVVLEDIVLL
jgi:hypothetical protein